MGNDFHRERPSLDSVCQQLANNDPKLGFLGNFQRGPHWATRLSQALVGNTRLSGLMLSRDLIVEFSDEEAEALALGVSQSQVNTIDMAFFSLGNMQHPIPQPFFDGIRAVASLRTISLTNIALENNHYFTVLPQLTTLKLHGVGLSEPTAQALAASIVESKNLQDLCLARLRASTPAETLRVWQILLEAVRRSGSITCLQLRGARIWQLEGFQDRFSKLVRLGLYGLGPQDQGDEIAMLTNNILQNAANLSSLSLSLINFRPVDVARLAQGLQNNTSIGTLSLIDCNLETEGAVEIIRALADHPKAKYLHFFSNRAIGYAGLRRIAHELEVIPVRSNLKHVQLRSCVPIIMNGQPPMSPVETLSKHQAAQALLQAMVHNRRILSLQVGGNAFGKDFERSIEFYNTVNSTGWHHLSADREYTPADWYRVLGSCRFRDPKLVPSLVFFYLQQNPTLVRPRNRA